MLKKPREVLKKIFGRRRVQIAICGILAAVGIISLAYNPAVVSAAAAKRVLPIYSVERDDKAVSLTFDAAWGNEDTQMLIDILAEYNVKATFFVVGEWVDKYPESVKALHDAGHEVMNHSNDHAHFSKLTESEIRANVTACNEKIAAVTGVTPDIFRCPYGEYDDHVVSTLNSMGIYTIQWDVDSLDWKDLSATEIQKRVLEGVNSGSIVLFHNAALHTPEALSGIIEQLQAKGYSILPVSQLIHRENYEMDHTGRQCPTTAEAPAEK